jgi:S-adenosylmethionine-diacylgycerolhomoserine-N-methlytransferase
VRIAQADAANFDPQRVFGRAGFDRIFISYAVSMIPSWRAVMGAAMDHLAPQGELHVVDFGDQKALPPLFRSGLRAWLRLYHVIPRQDLFEVAEKIAASVGGSAVERRLYRDFAWLSVITKSGA